MRWIKRVKTDLLLDLKIRFYPFHPFNSCFNPPFMRNMGFDFALQLKAS